jgi:hypothetical protein
VGPLRVASGHVRSPEASEALSRNRVPIIQKRSSGDTIQAASRPPLPEAWPCSPDGSAQLVNTMFIALDRALRS